MKNPAMLLLVLLVGVVSAAGQAVTSTFPVSFFIPASQCPQISADISGSGLGHMVSRITVDNNGVLHGGFSFDIHGTATDANGAQYFINHNDVFSFNRPAATPPVELTFTEKFYLIGQAQAPNVSLQGVFHVTILADGTVKSFVDNFKATGADGCFPE
jgi:hypothetical protein